MLLTYKVQLYPNKKQQETLTRQLELCRKLYNRLLEEIKRAKKHKEKVTKVSTLSLIVWLKNHSTLELKEVYSKVLQMVNYNLWNNIKSLSVLKKNGNKIGKLRYKGKGWYKTINYNQSGFKIDEQKNKLTFSKIGTINCRGLNHRVRTGKVKGIIIKRAQTGKWFAHIQVETKDKHPLPSMGKSVGLDVGVDHLIVDSDANSIENPKHIDKSIKKIIQLQRCLTRKKKGSRNWHKTKLQLAKKYEHLSNQRRDYLHKVSHYYVRTYDTIIVEDLDIKSMLTKEKKKRTKSITRRKSFHTLHRHILDVSWGILFHYLDYKAEKAGRTFKKVNPRGTSQTCSNCGQFVPKDLCTRVHLCPFCGLKLDRDYNASINILKRGTGRTSLLVETTSLTLIDSSTVVSGRLLSLKQETSFI
ncbi:MAG: RNA-guided endonuclease InsQ/TnpB family protein [Candidatus Heimdallarchaeaceae archaeon]